MEVGPGRSWKDEAVDSWWCNQHPFTLLYTVFRNPPPSSTGVSGKQTPSSAPREKAG